MAGKPRNYRSFEQAREFARSLNLSTAQAWINWCRANRPKDIPVRPDCAYRSSWKDWHDWLGTVKRVLPFEDARAIARQIAADNNLKTGAAWFEWRQANKIKGVPVAPYQVYPHEWQGWDDWLGKPRYLSFQEARNIVRAAGLTSTSHWFDWYKANKPERVPSRPDRVYPEFQSWADWIREEP